MPQEQNIFSVDRRLHFQEFLSQVLKWLSDKPYIAAIIATGLLKGQGLQRGEIEGFNGLFLAFDFAFLIFVGQTRQVDNSTMKGLPRFHAFRITGMPEHVIDCL